MIKLKILIIFSIFFNYCFNVYANTIVIKVKINNEIVTNIDIENEKKYLYFLNPKLKELEISRVNQISKQSLITDIIKKNELEKFFDFNKKNNLIKNVEKKFLLKKNIKNKEEFKKILESRDLDYSYINNKLYIETLWNQLIYKKYIGNIVINKNDLREEIQDKIKKEKKKFSYNLSEIFIAEDTDQVLKKKINTIYKSIEQIGFENTANIYSISNTANSGGLIGWINELQISKKINNEIKNINKNETSKPIKLQNGYVFIKVNDKKELKNKINIDDQLKKLINNETNRQLSNFSTIFYKKIKKNIEINEY